MPLTSSTPPPVTPPPDSCLLSPDSSPSASSNPHSAFPIPHSDLAAHGLAFFSAIFVLVRTVLAAVVKYHSADPNQNCIRTLSLAFECLTAIMRLEYTINAAPERITPRQLLRLAKASRALTRLTGQAFDFSPWTALTPSDLDAISPKPTPSPLSLYRLRPLEYRMPPSGQGPISLLQHPGATLANVIKKLARILPPDYSPATFIPDLSPSPSQSPSQSELNGMESPSPSPSCSHSELESQSQSRSHSQSIRSTRSTGSITSNPSTPSTPSTPSIESIESIPPVPQSPCLQVPQSSSISQSPCPQVPLSSSPSPRSALRAPP